MKLYLLSQDIVDDYDTFDSVVVAAHSPEDARTIHPSEHVTHVSNGKWMAGKSKDVEFEVNQDEWVDYSSIEHIQTVYLGETDMRRGVILASFNAG